MKRPYQPCKYPLCPSLTREGYCSIHIRNAQENANEQYNQIRNKDLIAFYKSKEWKKARLVALARDNHLCVHCLRNGLHTLAKHVDHIVEIRDDFALRLTLSNLQSLCIPCHNTKTRDEQKRRAT